MTILHLMFSKNYMNVSYLGRMNKTDKDTLYVVLFLVMLILLDMGVIAGILYKGQANFADLLKHLKS